MTRYSVLLFWATLYITRSVKFKCSLSNAKNVSIDQLMLYLAKLEESHPRKLSCTSLTRNTSPSFYRVAKKSKPLLDYQKIVLNSIKACH